MQNKTEEIRKFISDLNQNWLAGKLPSDKEINLLANLIISRDYVVMNSESFGLCRGIVQGMQLMRQIVESREDLRPGNLGRYEFTNTK